MTRVLVHLVLHCVFSTRIGPLKVTRSACVCTHAQYVTACNAHLRCANQGIVRILLLPGANAPNVHKCTFATEKNLYGTFMACQGSKVKLWGVPGPDQARPTQCALFNPKVKGQTLGEVPGPDQARPTQCALFGPKVKGQKVHQNPPRTYYSCACHIDLEHPKRNVRMTSCSTFKSRVFERRRRRGNRK